MKQSLLLLHGALGSKEQMAAFANELSDQYKVYTFSFSGHGNRVSEEVDFSIGQFANDVIVFMNGHQIKETSIFGYSMGGYVALFLARYFPERVNQIMTLATKFKWTPESASNEVKMLNPELMVAKVPAFVSSLKHVHGTENWSKVVCNTALMMTGMGRKNPLQADDFSKIEQSVMLTLGDQDKMVSREETEQIQKLIAGSRFALFENTPHPFEKVDLHKLKERMNLFFYN